MWCREEFKSWNSSLCSFRRFRVASSTMSSVHCLRIFLFYVIPLISKNKCHSNLNNKKNSAVFSSFIFFINYLGDWSVILISGVALLLKMSLSDLKTISDWSDVRILTPVFLKFPHKVRQLARHLCEPGSQYKQFQALQFDHINADWSCTALRLWCSKQACPCVNKYVCSCDNFTFFGCIASNVTWQNDCRWYVVGSKSFRPDQLFKVTEIKQLCYFATQSPFISTHFSTDTLTSPQMTLYIPHSILNLARVLYVRPETFGPYYVPRNGEPNSGSHLPVYTVS